MDCRKDIYSRLDTLRTGPGFIDRDSKSQEYAAYCEILSGLPVHCRKYYLSRGKRQEAQREAYAQRLSRKPRHYTHSSIVGAVGGSIVVGVSRSDFPLGPEGAREYRKAYSRERYRLKSQGKGAVSQGKGPVSPGYTVSEKVLAARKTRRTRWDTVTGRHIKEQAAARRNEKARLVSIHREVDPYVRSFLKGPSIVLWTVQGGGVPLRDVQRNEMEEGAIVEGSWTLDSFYSSLQDGAVKTLLEEPCMKGSGAMDLLPRIHEAVSDSVVLVDMYNNGEELPDDVRGEINLLRTERSEILKILSGIRRRVKAEALDILYKRQEAGLPLDLDSALRPLCILHLLTSAVNAANWMERRGLYLYYKCHKHQMYRRRVKVERRLEDEARREQFRRLDKALGPGIGASGKYWEGRLKAGPGDGKGPSI